LAGYFGPRGIDWHRYLVFVLVGGDDSTLQWILSDTPNYNILDDMLAGPMKTKCSYGVMEFFSWIFTPKGFYYNPVTLSSKMLNKNLDLVTSNSFKFEEYLMSLKDLMYPYYENLPQAAIDIALYLEKPVAWVENLLINLTWIFNKRSFEIKKFTTSVVLEDFIGGTVYTDDFENSRNLQIMSDILTISGKTLEYLEKNPNELIPLVEQLKIDRLFNKPYVNPQDQNFKGQLYEMAAKISVRIATVVLGKSGPDHSPLFNVQVSIGSKAMVISNAPNVRAGEQCACSYLMLMIKLYEKALNSIKVVAPKESWTDRAELISESMKNHLYLVGCLDIPKEVADAYSAVLQQALNKLMHSANGNIDYVINPYDFDNIPTWLHETFGEEIRRAKVTNKEMHALHGNGNLSSKEEKSEKDKVYGIRYISGDGTTCLSCGDNCGYQIFLANNWNKLMHSRNGNMEGRMKLKGKKSNAKAIKPKKIIKKIEKKVDKREKKIERKDKSEVRSLVRRAARPVAMRIAPNSQISTPLKAELNKITKDVRKIVAALTMVDRPIRWGDAYNAEKTAAVAVEMGLNTNWSNGTVLNTSGYSGALPDGEMILVGFKNLLRNFIVYDPNPQNAQSTYTFYGVGEYEEYAETAPANTWNIALDIAGNWYALKMPYAVTSSEWQPHGPTWFSGFDPSDTQLCFFWLDYGTLNITGTAGEGYSYLIQAVQWTDQGIADFEGGYWGSLTGNFSIATTVGFKGYIAFKIKCETDDAYNGNVTNLVVQFTVKSQCYGHLAAPNLLENAPSIGSARVAGCGILYTNRAAPIYRGGSRTQLQLPLGVNWFKYMVNGYKQLLADKGASSDNTDNGSWTYMKMASNRDTQFKPRQFKTNPAQQLIDCRYDLTEESPQLVVYYQIPVNSAQGRDGLIRLRTSLEYQTTDMFREVKGAPFELEAYQKAIEVMKPMPQYLSNEFHIEELWKNIKEIGDGIVKYLPYAKAVLDAFA